MGIILRLGSDILDHMNGEEAKMHMSRSQRERGISLLPPFRLSQSHRFSYLALHVLVPVCSLEHLIGGYSLRAASAPSEGACAGFPSTQSD